MKKTNNKKPSRENREIPEPPELAVVGALVITPAPGTPAAHNRQAKLSDAMSSVEPAPAPAPTIDVVHSVDGMNVAFSPSASKKSSQQGSRLQTPGAVGSRAPAAAVDEPRLLRDRLLDGPSALSPSPAAALSRPPSQYKTSRLRTPVETQPRMRTPASLPKEDDARVPSELVIDMRPPPVVSEDDQTVAALPALVAPLTPGSFRSIPSARKQGVLPGFASSSPLVPASERAPPLPAGAVRMVANRTPTAPNSPIVLTTTRPTPLLLESGVSIDIGSSPLPFSQLAPVVKQRLVQAGYVNVEATLLGDTLQISAKSPVAQLRAELLPPRSRSGSPVPPSSPASPGAVHGAVDGAAGLVAAGSAVVFVSGEVVELGSEPVPFDQLRAVVATSHEQAGYSDVQCAIGDDGMLSATGRSNVDLTAHLPRPTSTHMDMSHPSPPRPLGSTATSDPLPPPEPVLLPDSLLTLSQTTLVALGPEPVPLGALPNLISRKLAQMGYSSVQCSVVGETVRTTDDL